MKETKRRVSKTAGIFTGLESEFSGIFALLLQGICFLYWKMADTLDRFRK